MVGTNVLSVKSVAEYLNDGKCTDGNSFFMDENVVANAYVSTLQAIQFATGNAKNLYEWDGIDNVMRKRWSPLSQFKLCTGQYHYLKSEKTKRVW